MYFISHISVCLCEYMYRYILHALWVSHIYILTERCMFMPHSLKQDFPFSIHRGLSLSNLLFLFAQGLVYKMEHHHHFSSYLTVCLSYCLPILLRQNPSISVVFCCSATFPSSLAFGDFTKGLFGLLLSGTITSHFNLYCQCLCCLGVLWPKSCLWFKPRARWAGSQALELCALAAAQVQPNCIDLSGLDYSKSYQNCRKRISSD